MGASLEALNVPGVFNPATMAFWVRVPQESLAAVPTVTGFRIFRCLWDLIPFVTFGPQVVGINNNGDSAILPPSYIGMNTSGGVGSLEVNLICGSGSGSLVSMSPDYYGNAQLDATFESGGFPLLSAGKWHHIMVSWQINGQTVNGEQDSVMGSSLMYCFIDGVAPPRLPAMQFSFPGSNTHVSHVINFSGAFPDQTASSTGGPINGSPLTFPCSPNAQVGSADGALPNPFQKIEMAEFYLYCGRMLTSMDGFVEQGKPAKRKDVFARLGEPTLCMSGSGSWIKGKGKGQNKVEFRPTGTIKRYKPDPKMGG